MDLGETISLAVGIIGTVIAVYQCAVINESKKRKNELQYLLAGINNTALQKQMAWQNQMQLLPQPQNERDLEIYRIHSRARDDCASISGLVTALEGAISSDSSAITEMLKQSKEQIKLNNELQEEGLRNPTFKVPENSTT